jgi:hypothetical protein
MAKETSVEALGMLWHDGWWHDAQPRDSKAKPKANGGRGTRAARAHPQQKKEGGAPRMQLQLLAMCLTCCRVPLRCIQATGYQLEIDEPSAIRQYKRKV